MIRIKLIIAILALMLCNNLYADNSREIIVDSVSCVHLLAFNDNCTPVTISGQLFNPVKPTDAVVVIVHGSQGVDQRHANYAKYLNSIGFSALVLDSWLGRGITKAHFDFAGNEKKGARAYNLAIDALRAVDVLKKQPEGFKRVGFIGESMGGSAAIWLVKPYLHREYLKLFSVKAPEVQANIAVYGGCFERISTDKFIPIPTLFLGGELDDDTPAIYCEKFSGWMNSRGGIAASIVLKGQYHDFDAPYKLHTSDRAENPSECASYIDGGNRFWEKTGEKFPMTADGYRDFQRKCVRSASVAPVMTGHIESQSTGFKEWGDFFIRVLGTP